MKGLCAGLMVSALAMGSAAADLDPVVLEAALESPRWIQVAAPSAGHLWTSPNAQILDESHVSVSRTESIQLLIPAAAAIEIHSERILGSDDLILYLADGNGLGRRIDLDRVLDFSRKVGVLEPTTDHRVLRLEGGPGLQTDLQLRLVERHILPTKIKRTFRPLDLPENALVENLKVVGHKSGRKVLVLEPWSPLEIQVDGPLHLRIGSRLAYPARTTDHRQSCELLIVVDKNPAEVRHLTFIAGGQPVEVGGLLTSLSQTAYTFLDIADGRHSLRLMAPRRLITSVEGAAWIEPLLAMNRNDPETAEVWRNLAESARVEGPSPPGYPRRFLTEVHRGSTTPPAFVTRDILDTQALNHLELPQLGSLARLVAGRSLFFRDLEPLAPRTDIVRRAFHRRRLVVLPTATTSPDDRTVALPAPLANSLADSVPSSTFVPLGAGESLEFSLPPQPETRIRLAVLTQPDHSETLLLSSDCGDWEEILLDPLLVAPEALTQASLASLADTIGRDRFGELGAPFRLAPPLPVNRVSSLVVNLSPGCRRLSLTRTGEGPPLAVALAGQAEREHTLPEQALIDLVNFVDRGDPLGATARDGLDHLQQNLRRRERDAIAREHEFVGDRALPWQLDDRTEGPRWDPAVDPIMQLESLTQELRDHGGGWTDIDLVVHALDLLGERFLAKSLLRAVALKAPTVQVRRHAARAWLDRARAEGESGLTAAIILSQSQQGGSTGLSEVATELIAAGDPHDALWPALMAGPEGEPQVAQVSEALDWWEFASDHETQAEARASAWLEPSNWQNSIDEIPAVAEDLEIYRRLTDENLEVRGQALLRWEALSQRPLKKRWRRLDRRAVKAHAGGVLFRSRTSGKTGRRWLATPEQPIGLDVAPGETRLEFRTLFPAGKSRSDDQWVLVSSCGLARPVLVRGGPASTTLELPSRGDSQLSIARRASLNNPPGCWKLEIRPETGPVAVTVDRTVSDSLWSLPAFEPETATRTLLPPLRKPVGTAARNVLITPSATPQWPPESRRTPEDSAPARQPKVKNDDSRLVQPVVLGAMPSTTVIHSLPAPIASRLGLRLGLAAEPHWLESLAEATSHGPESLVATARWRGLDDACAHETVSAETAPYVAFACIGSNRIDRALDVLSEGISRTQGDQRRLLLGHRLELMFYAADHGLIPRQASIVEAAEIAREYPEDPSLAGFADHALAQTTWRRLTPSLSAGIRLVGVPGWHRSGTSMRARLALLDKEPTAERFLAGDESISLEIGNQTPSTTRLELEAHGLSIFRPEPSTAVWRLLDREADHALLAEGTVDLSPGQREIVLIDVPAGRSLLEVNSVGPRPNQLLSVNLDEAGQDGGDRQELLDQALARRLRFDVARPNQPIELVLTGPAWVRADHLTDTGIRRTYHRIENGPQVFKIESSEEALARLWVLETTPPRSRPSVDIPQVPPLDPQWEAPDEEILSVPGYRAESLINGSSDATRDVSVFWRHRRSFDEDDSDDDAEEHVEARYRRRLYINPDHFRQSTLLTRVHEGTDLVFGISEDHRLLFSGWRLRLAARLFAQEPVSRDVSTGSPWWSVEGRAGIERWSSFSPRFLHRPGLMTRARVLSLDEDDAGVAGSIDNDIWTPYKADHLFALRLSDRVDYLAYDDMRLWAGVTLTTNENPFKDGIDNMRFAIGATQLVGDFEARASIAASTYFSDNDRLAQVTRPLLGLDLRFDRWVLTGHRMMAHLSWRHEIDTGRNSIAAGLTWVFEKGLGWRNEPPGTNPFRSRKLRRAAERTALDVEP